jgi:transposase
MDQTAIVARQERGAALAKAKARAFRKIAGDTFFVPSATTSGGGYVVELSARKCSCPDHETTGCACKHVFSLEYHLSVLQTADGASAVSEIIRVSYPQDWPAYNKSQVEEGDRLRVLLASLCDGIVEPPRKATGRKPMPLRDAVYGAVLKVYGGKSCRLSSSALRDAREHMGRVPAYNTIFKFAQKPELLPILLRMVEESARPLAAVERQFAADATGFASETYVRWFDYKHNEDKRVQQWVKAHAMVGTLTNVVTSLRVTEGNANDCPELPALLDGTVAAGFDVQEVSADKGYLSNANVTAIERVGARPFIPFKINSTGTGSEAWERMYCFATVNRDLFLVHYHRRSNVESAFSAMKRKFGDNVRARLPDAMFNEVAMKAICHNLSCVVHAIHELGIDPKFWLPRPAGKVLP